MFYTLRFAGRALRSACCVGAPPSPLRPCFRRSFVSVASRIAFRSPSPGSTFCGLEFGSAYHRSISGLAARTCLDFALRPPLSLSLIRFPPFALIAPRPLLCTLRFAFRALRFGRAATLTLAWHPSVCVKTRTQTRKPEFTFGHDFQSKTVQSG